MVMADESAARRPSARVFSADRPQFSRPSPARLGLNPAEPRSVTAAGNPVSIDPRRALLDRLAAISVLTECAAEDAERLSRASRFMEYVGGEADADVFRWNLVSGARDELIYCLPAPLSPRRLAELRASTVGVVGRQVDTTFVCAPAVLRNPQNFSYLGAMAEAGAAVHQVEMGVIDVVIVDRRVALLPTNQDRADQGYMIVTVETVIEILRGFALLPIAHKMAPGNSHRDLERSSMLRKVAASLNTSATDEIAARSIRTSVRTFRRHVADLMRELGVESRFQAGVAAARQGLVP